MTWRTLNLVGFILWLLCVPAAALFGWYRSIPFVAIASIYANAVSHLAGWRADVPSEETAFTWLLPGCVTRPSFVAYGVTA